MNKKMKTSDKLYHINATLSIIIVNKENLNTTEIEDLNLKLGKIIKEIRELENE